MKRKWSELQKMDEEEIRNEWMNLAKEIQGLSNYVGEMKNEEEHENFLKEFSYCLDTLHSLRHRTDSFYFKKID